MDNHIFLHVYFFLEPKILHAIASSQSWWFECLKELIMLSSVADFFLFQNFSHSNQRPYILIHSWLNYYPWLNILSLPDISPYSILILDHLYHLKLYLVRYHHNMYIIFAKKVILCALNINHFKHTPFCFNITPINNIGYI